MKDEFLKFSPRRILYSMVITSAFLASSPRLVFADVNEVQTRMQIGTVKGQVVDVSGEPVIGASIRVKGANSGTITDVNGDFSLDNASNSVLVISYIGYKTQEISVGGKTSIKIILKEDSEILDEVVVVAYGSTVKRKLTNAVSTVNVKQIENLAGYSDVTSSLQGRAPGVIITNSDGSLNAQASISIRGGGDPLYIVDGIVADKGIFSLLNPQDIESISIMKDAASSAVYGAQAGNGIVVITTKKGVEGKARLNYTFDQQFNAPAQVRDRLSSYELAVASNQIYDMWGASQPAYSDEAIEAWRTGSDPIAYPNIDWWDSLIRKAASSQRHTLTLDGGSKTTQYHMSVGYYNQNSVFKPHGGKEINDRNRYNISLNVNHLFENIGLKVGMDIKAYYDKKHGKDEKNMMGSLAFRLPWERIYTTDGRWYANTSAAYLDSDGEYQDVENNVFTARFNADWDIPKVKGLKATFVAKTGAYLYSTKSWKNVYIPTYYDDGTVVGASSKPELNMGKSEGHDYELNIGLAYSRTFLKDHNLNVAVYYNQRENWGNGISASRKEYKVNVDQIFAGPSSTAGNGGTASESGRLGYVGTLGYDYKGRYLLNASFRYDGSDGFTPDKRWGFFPSASLGYIISDEPFMKKIREAVKMDMLKFRFSYGETGQEAGRFNYLTSWTLGDVSFDINGDRAGSVTTPGIPSTVLTWYTNKTFNYGMDFAFFNNRLSGTADYFVTEINGYDINPADYYTTTLGTSLPKVMSDDLFRRAGAEFTLRWKDSWGAFTYDVGGNISFYDELWVRKNEALDVSSNPLRRSVGKTLSSGDRMWVSNGLYQTPSDLINSPRPTWSDGLKTGDISYVDINGDGRIDTDGTNSDDKIYNNMPSKPIIQYGIDFNLGYKGFSLTGLFQGSGTKYSKIGNNVKPAGVERLLYKDQLDYWRPDNTGARFPLPDLNQGTTNNMQADVTFWSVNCAYLRLKNLQLGYDFKYKLLKKVSWLSSAKLSLVGTNLLTFSDVSGWLDPEQSETQNWAYPMTKTYSIMVSLGF